MIRMNGGQLQLVDLKLQTAFYLIQCKCKQWLKETLQNEIKPLSLDIDFAIIL